MCQPKRRISRALYAVGRQTPQLYECKVSRYEARRFPPAFGKDELNLGISQSLSTGGLSRTTRRRDRNEGHEQHAPARPSCVARPAAGADCTKISRQITDRSYVRALCDADVIELHRRWPAEATCRVPSGPLMQRRQTKARLYFPLRDLERSEYNSGGRSHRTAWAD